MAASHEPDPATVLTDDDVAHMRNVHGHAQRHLARRPGKEDVETSRWRHSLVNWGHDPLK